MSANGISELGTKAERQAAKLAIAQAKRQGKTVAVDGTITGTVDPTQPYYRGGNIYDLTSLPNPYDAGDNINNVDETANEGGLIQGRPWVGVVSVTAPETIAEALPANTLIELQIWYDGADTSTYVPSATDELGITQWTDKSAFAHNARPSGGIATRPTYEDSFLKNGNGYLNFSGPTVGQYLTISPVAWAESLQNYTVFVVARRSSGATSSGYQYIIGSDTGDFGIGRTSVTGNFVVTSSDSGGTRQHDTNIVNTAGTWYLCVLSFDGTGVSNSDKLKLRVDGTLANITFESTVTTSTYSFIDNVSIGGTTNNQSESWEGDIGEVLFFTKTLTATEIANVENYLSNKWDL